jgi:hypothetical protein
MLKSKVIHKINRNEQKMERRYFTCKPDHGLLVRPNKITVRGINGAKLLGDYYGSKEGTPEDMRTDGR